jgi:hypothetical protein
MLYSSSSYASARPACCRYEGREQLWESVWAVAEPESEKKGRGPTTSEAQVMAQSPNGIGGESHSPPALGGLGLAEDETLTGQPLDRLLHVKDVGVQVHVLPPEA